MQTKLATYEDAIHTLNDVATQLDSLKNVVQVFLDAHENHELIPRILEKAQKNNKGAITPSWVSRKFDKGYARSCRIVDLLLAEGLIAPAKTRNKSKFLVV